MSGAHPWPSPMRPRPGDGESIRWTKLVVGGLLGAVAGLVGWVSVTAPPPVERPLRFGKDAAPEVFNRIAALARCAIMVRAGDEVRPAFKAVKRVPIERLAPYRDRFRECMEGAMDTLDKHAPEITAALMSPVPPPKGGLPHVWGPREMMMHNIDVYIGRLAEIKKRRSR